MRSAMVMRLRLCFSANRTTSAPRITVPSSFISSERTPTNGKPASRHRSMHASVWPERISTPPSRATSGNTWPGRTKSVAPLLGLASARTVLVRSSAEMPVVSPWRTSTETVNAVPSGASFSATMGSRWSRLASSTDKGAQTMPEVWRMMKAIFSAVHLAAATNRSPSFSRSSSSATTTISPRPKAAATSSMRSWDSRGVIGDCPVGFHIPLEGEVGPRSGPGGGGSGTTSSAPHVSPRCHPTPDCLRQSDPPPPGEGGRMRSTVETLIGSRLRSLKRPRWAFAHLSAMAQIVIGEHARHHGLADRHRPDADARVMAAAGGDLRLAAVAVDGAARRQDRRCRFDGETRHDRLAGGDAAQNPARIVGEETRLAVSADPHLVGVVLAGQGGRRKAGADLDALHGIDGHQRGGDIAVELAVDRRPEARRHALGDHLDDGADRGALPANAVEIGLEKLGHRGVRTEERVARNLVPIPFGAVDPVRPHGNERGPHRHAGDDLSRHRAGRHPRSGLARRRAPAAAVVAQAVLGVVGIVRMARAVEIADFGIILGALVDVLDHQRDRGPARDLKSGRVVHHHAGENLHLVRLAALGGEARLARAAAVEIVLDVGGLERNFRRTAVDYATDRSTVAFAEGGDPEQVAEGVVGHRVSLSAVGRVTGAKFVAIPLGSWPGSSRPSRQLPHCALLIEIAGTSPAMTNWPPRVLPLLHRQAW